jgi:hypothetical protein
MQASVQIYCTYDDMNWEDRKREHGISELRF